MVLKKGRTTINSKFSVCGKVGKPFIRRTCPSSLVLPVFPVASDKSLDLFKPQDLCEVSVLPDGAAAVPLTPHPGAQITLVLTPLAWCSAGSGAIFRCMEKVPISGNSSIGDLHDGPVV